MSTSGLRPQNRRILAWVAALGAAGLAAAVALAGKKKPATDATVNNGKKDVPGKQITAIAVTKDNMREFLEETSWLTAKEVYASS